jgi:hypothetical protein
MAGRIIDGTRPHQYVPGMANKVISITEPKIQAVAYGDEESRRCVMLTMTFGTEEDGGLGVFLFADDVQMRDQLRIPPDLIKKEVRAWYQAQTPMKGEDIPASATSVATEQSGTDLGSLDVGGEK